jgi:hypothetical protein
MPPQPVISFALTKEIPDCPDAGSRCLPYSTRASRVNDLNNLCGVLLACALPINMPNRNARSCSGGFMSLILVFARKWVGWYRLLRYRKAFSFADSIRFGLWLARG